MTQENKKTLETLLSDNDFENWDIETTSLYFDLEVERVFKEDENKTTFTSLGLKRKNGGM